MVAEVASFAVEVAVLEGGMRPRSGWLVEGGVCHEDFAAVPTLLRLPRPRRW